MKTIKILLSLLVLAVLGVAAFVWSGVYPMGADVPHSPLVFNLMETMRQRSIALRAKDIQVPPLDGPKMIADGAEHYSAMCTGCHLAPGVTDSEIRPGLYPQPPDLTQPLQSSPAEKFWAIKHGIKMSAMPAWGTTHDDQAIWGMVAFLEKLPGMTLEQYKALTGGGEASGEHHHHHGDADHGHDEHSGASESPDAAGHDESDHQHHEHAAAAETEHHHEAAADTEPYISMEGLKPGAVPAAEALARAFQSALQTGDRDKVLALLAPNATITESGKTQSRDEYASEHLGEDIAFLNTAQVTLVSSGSMPMGETAMVGSESDIATRGKPSVIRSREMLTLKRDGDAWKIQSVRWQSGADSKK